MKIYDLGKKKKNFFGWWSEEIRNYIIIHRFVNYSYNE